MNRRIKVTLVTAATAVGVGVLAPGTAYAATYDGQDPNSSGCARTASTVRSANVYVQGDPSLGLVGRIQLRYSSACRTVWARVLLYTEPTGGFAEVVRNTDGSTQECNDAFWQQSLGAYSCYTMMLNDRNVTSYGYGGRSADGEQARTGSY
jgi:Protein of unknown function (DUF2690)